MDNKPTYSARYIAQERAKQSHKKHGGLIGGNIGTLAGLAIGSKLNIKNKWAKAGVAGLGSAAMGGGFMRGAIGGLMADPAKEAILSRLKSEQEVTDAQKVQNDFGGALRPQRQVGLRLGDSVRKAREIGFEPTPENFNTIAERATGKYGFHNITKQEILKMGGHINLSGVDDMINHIIGSKMDLSVDNKESHQFLRDFTDSTNKLLTGKEGALPNELSAVDPEKAFHWIQGLGKKYTELDEQAEKSAAKSLTGRPDPELEEKKNIAHEIYKEAKRLVYRDELNQFVAKHTDTRAENVAMAVENASGGKIKFDLSDPQQMALAKKLAEEFSQAQTIQDLLSHESDYVRMGRAGQIAQRFKEQAVATPQTVRQAKAGVKEHGILNMLGGGSSPMAGLLNIIGK